MSEDRYVLRSRDAQELSRLEAQHRIWKEWTDDVLRRAGYGVGHRVMDLGSGPGFLTLELAEIVGPEGHVLAIDRSETFIRHLSGRAGSSGLRQVRAEAADLAEFAYPDAAFDGAICRWVLMFVPEPERVVARVARALRPGGVFAILEYARFRSMALWPAGRCFRRIYDAVHALIARSGGDADIGGRAPSILHAAGFDVVEIVPILRVGRPGSPIWKWLEATHVNHTNLIDAGLVTSDELDAYHREWEERSDDPSAFFITPPVLATIARKRPPSPSSSAAR